MWLHRYIEIYPSIYGMTRDDAAVRHLGDRHLRSASSALGLGATSQFMDAFPRMRVVLMTSPYRDEVQVPVDPEDDGAAAGARVGRRRCFNALGDQGLQLLEADRAGLALRLLPATKHQTVGIPRI